MLFVMSLMLPVVVVIIMFPDDDTVSLDDGDGWWSGGADLDPDVGCADIDPDRYIGRRSDTGHADHACCGVDNCSYCTLHVCLLLLL